MRAWGIVVAAGRGERLGGGVPKALRPLGGIPMVEWSLRAFDAVRAIERVVVVGPAGFEAGGRVAVAGGPTRQRSVREGLACVPDDVEAVAIHDAARPLVTPALIERSLAALSGADGAVCAVPVADTLKRVQGKRIEATVARDGLWGAQTPQAFRLGVLREAHDRALAEGIEDATDDALLVERAGGTVVVVPGDERNIKVTTEADLALAEALLRG